MARVKRSHCRIRNLSEIDSLPHLRNLSEMPPPEQFNRIKCHWIRRELPLHTRRHRPDVVVTVAAVGEPNLEVLLDAAIEHALARAAWPIPRRCAVNRRAPRPAARR